MVRFRSNDIMHVIVVCICLKRNKTTNAEKKIEQEEVDTGTTEKKKYKTVHYPPYVLYIGLHYFPHREKLFSGNYIVSRSLLHKAANDIHNSAM